MNRLYTRPAKIFLLVIFLTGIYQKVQAQSQSLKTLWTIGTADNSGSEFALAPSGYHDFLKEDFGWENKFYLIGFSTPQKDWPYVLPGPKDHWGGSNEWAGLRASVLNIVFGIDTIVQKGDYELTIDLVNTSSENAPLLKVTVNDTSWEFPLPKGTPDSTLSGEVTKSEGTVLKIPVPGDVIRTGGNKIVVSIIRGSWIAFDQVKMSGPENIKLSHPRDAFINDVKAADYEVEIAGKRFQPLLVDIQHLGGEPTLSVAVDGQKIFEKVIEEDRYVFEAPMAAVTEGKQSSYTITLNNRTVQTGRIYRSEKKKITPAGYVNTMMGAAHSRWMLAPGPWMPFGMVKLSPDNQDEGWQAGYDPIFESIGGFSHIHEWTMSGLSMLPVNGPLITKMGDQTLSSLGYRSAIDKKSEDASLGYYKVHLLKYNIWAELTATTRCSFQRYTYPPAKDSRILVDFNTPAEYKYSIVDARVTKVSDHRVEGYTQQVTKEVWGKGIDQNYTVYFVMEFDRPISTFKFLYADASAPNEEKKGTVSGFYVEFNTSENPAVQVRTGISYVSIKNAAQNLHEEIEKPFGWDFNSVKQANIDTWNELLKRIEINTVDRREKIRFYTNFYRALAGRNTFSDVNGQWVDATEKVQQLKDPNDIALGCDAFWNTFWNLNQLWNLVTPEWSLRWVKSQLAMYDANGALAKGPAGMEYIPVMVAEHEIPLIVSAYQMGIRGFDVEKAYSAVRKMVTKPAWKIDDGLAGNADLDAFLKYHYVPSDKGKFSNSMEYAYDNWTVSEFAKSLGKTQDQKLFSDRGNWWKNAVNPQSGYAQMREADGNWVAPFDPFQTGQNKDYVEGNAWQLTYFVPQNIPGLIKWIGKERFIDRLKWGFDESYKWRFNAPGENYSWFPVDQGNQQSMHFAFLFNYAGAPYLTQKWSRSILSRYYGYGLSDAYLGDEDQGQMSGWFVMAAIGLFQVDGGCSINPSYGIASPLYEKITIDLGKKFGRGKTFTILAEECSRKNKYIQSATLNGRTLTTPFFPAAELLKGGTLVLQMGPEPNEKWGATF